MATLSCPIRAGIVTELSQIIGGETGGELLYLEGGFVSLTLPQEIRSPSVWQMIPSLDTLVQGLAVVFTEPSFQTQREILLGWLMCVGQRTEYRVFQTIHASAVVSR